VPKLLSELQGPAFRRRFEAKGRFSEAMARVPVLAVMHPQAGLLGATALALQAARD
jgi:glucokinase